MSSLDKVEYVEELFDKKDFQKERLDSIEFLECVFVNCNFAETIFQRCKFKECKFHKCNLSLIKVMDCSFMNSTFEDSKIIGVNWTEILWPKTRISSPINFIRCDISLSTFIGQNLREIVIKECRAHDVDFRETDLTRANLSHSDFAKSQFYETNLTKANFNHAKNYSIDIYTNKIAEAEFSLPEALSLLDSMNIKIDQTE